MFGRGRSENRGELRNSRVKIGKRDDGRMEEKRKKKRGKLKEDGKTNNRGDSKREEGE